MLTEIFS